MSFEACQNIVVGRMPTGVMSGKFLEQNGLPFQPKKVCVEYDKKPAEDVAKKAVRDKAISDYGESKIIEWGKFSLDQTLGTKVMNFFADFGEKSSHAQWRR